MFVFVHGAGGSQSLWLSQIRGLLGLGSEFTDREVIDIFTIEFPGHPRNDSQFGLKEFKKWMTEFQTKNSIRQSELAKKIILTGQPEIIRILQDPRVICIGHGAGGAFCLDFSLQNPSIIHKLVLISAGNQFNPLVGALGALFDSLLAKANTRTLRLLQSWTISKRNKILLTNLIENPNRKGYSAYKKYMRSFNFAKSFQNATLNQQLNFLRIPILLIHGRFDIMTSGRSVRKLEKVLDPNNPLIKSKKTIVNFSPLEFKGINLINYNSGHNLIDSHIVDFIYDVRSFLVRT